MGSLIIDSRCQCSRVHSTGQGGAIRKRFENDVHVTRKNSIIDKHMPSQMPTLLGFGCRRVFAFSSIFDGDENLAPGRLPGA